MANGSVQCNLDSSTSISDDLSRTKPELLPEKLTDELEATKPVNVEEIEDQESEEVQRCDTSIPKPEYMVITTACLSLINFELPEYPLHRKISIRDMITEIDQMRENYKSCVDVLDKEIIEWFKILYALQIENNDIQRVFQIEDMLKTFTSSESNGNATEARNLYDALNYIQGLAQRDQKDCGLIDVGRFILETHERILGPGKQGGVFSTKRRFGVVDKNTRHEYPKFDSEEDACSKVQLVIDHYNPLLDHLKMLLNKDSSKAIENLFKLCGMLLFKIMYYHPFGDGNGRLARLLSSYALSPFTPFPTPVYGLFSPSTREEYVDALVEAREKETLSTLTALIIESSYHTWKKFDEVVKMNENGENWKELLLSCYKRWADENKGPVC